MLRALCCVILAAVPQQPQFRSGVERIVIDLQVVDSQGRPVPQLTAADFDVKIGQGRRVVSSAEFVRAAENEAPPPGRANTPTATTEGEGRRVVGRDFILAIDESSFRTQNAPAAIRAARGFISRLNPDDRVGLFTYPASPRFFALTPDHFAVDREVGRVVGTFEAPSSQYHMSVSEIMDIAAGEQDVVRQVAQRECLPQPTYQGECMRRIPGEVTMMVSAYEGQAQAGMSALRRLFLALLQDPKRKTVVVISGGLLASDRAGGRPDVAGLIQQISYEAAESNANLYVLHLDSSFLDTFSASNANRIPMALMRESSAFEGGLDRLAAAAGGARVHVTPGGEDAALGRILRETSAYYVLSVEPLDEDRDGRLHYISVRTTVPGAEVRARRTVMIPAK